MTELMLGLRRLIRPRVTRPTMAPVLPGESPLARDWRVIGNDGWVAVRRFEAENPEISEQVRGKRPSAKIPA